jgi:hypothetical protein
MEIQGWNGAVSTLDNVPTVSKASSKTPIMSKSPFQDKASVEAALIVGITGSRVTCRNKHGD